MKISKETLDILKNFSTINSNILITPGNLLTTISVAKNIVAEATIDESFDREFGIYDLNEFLSVYNITDNGDVYINEKYLDISWGNSKIKYVFADANVLTFPKKRIQFPEHIAEVVVSSDVIKTASVLKSPNLAIVSNGTNVKLKTFDKDNLSSNSYELDLSTEPLQKFSAVFDIKTLRLVPGDYTVKISAKGISHWQHAEKPLSYFIALDTSSTFE